MREKRNMAGCYSVPAANLTQAPCTAFIKVGRAKAELEANAVLNAPS